MKNLLIIIYNGGIKLEKQSISIKKVLILAGAFCAFWIGSGFATGQEVLQFCASSGVYKGTIGAIVYSLIMAFLMYTLYGVAQKEQFDNPYDVFEYYCGKKIGSAYVWFNFVMQYGVFVVMLAGGGATLNQYYGISASLGTSIVGILALGTVLLGVERLLDIIGVIGPIKIAFLFILGFSAIGVAFKQPDILSVNSAFIQSAGFETASGNWLWSSMLWAFLGLMTGTTFFVISGASCKSVKEARTTSLLGIGAIFLVVVMLVLTEVVYLEAFRGKQVPTLAIAGHISPILEGIFTPVITLCIYSAVAGMLLVVTRKFANDKTKKFNITAIALTAFGLLVGSLLPFDKLVNILYPISGYVGIIFVGFIIYKEFINKNAFPMNRSIKNENEGVNSNIDL